MPTKKTTKKSPAKKPTAKKSTTKKVAKKAVKKAPKKAAKKPAGKTKTASKKTAKKSVEKKITKKEPIVYAANETSFWTSDGQVLNSLLALQGALHEMEEAVYSFHAEGDQNDFAVWVEQVLCDKNCAKDMQKAKTPKAAKTTVQKHLKRYHT